MLQVPVTSHFHASLRVSSCVAPPFCSSLPLFIARSMLFAFRVFVRTLFVWDGATAGAWKRKWRSGTRLSGESMTYDQLYFTVTRGHPFKLFKKRPVSSTKAIFFSDRVVNVWNALPAADVDFTVLCFLCVFCILCCIPTSSVSVRSNKLLDFRQL